MTKRVSTRFELRNDTAENWVSANPVLLAGEPGIETDTNKWKVGDGVNTWADLPYFSQGGGSTGGGTWGSITGTLADQTDLQAALSGKLVAADLTAGLATKQDVLGFTPYNATNPDGFITSSALAPYATTVSVASGYQPLSSVLTDTTASFTTTKDTKLSGIATGATANSSDATLLSRANHTGSQATSTITGLDTALSNKQPLATVLTNTTASYTTALNTKLSGIATGATANDTDANLKNRANHTGTQLAATISDFNAAADARVALGGGGSTGLPYVSGNWYPTATLGSIALSAGATIAANKVRMIPFTVRRAVTITELGARVTTVSAGGLFGIGIYAANATTLKATGTPIATVTGLSTSTATVVSGAVTPVALAPNTLYWAAIHVNNTVAVFQASTPAAAPASFIIGDPVLGTASSAANTGISSLDAVGAYGSGLPDMTALAQTAFSTAAHAVLWFKAQ